MSCMCLLGYCWREQRKQQHGAKQIQQSWDVTRMQGAQLQRSVVQQMAYAPGVLMKPWHTARFMHWRNEEPGELNKANLITDMFIPQ